MFEHIKYSIEGHIGTLTINRQKSLNSLTKNTLEEIESVLDTISPEIKVLMITGAGEKAFVAGADIKEMYELTPIEAIKYVKFGQRAFGKLEDLPIPVIAVIEGYCLGGGLELAMACDIRVASEKARFGQPEVGLGIIPGFGGTQRLPRLVGKGIALEMLMTGQIIDAQRAIQIGLVNHVVKPEELFEKAFQIGHSLLSKSPSALSKVKVAVNKGSEMDIRHGLELEANLFGICFTEEDYKEGFKAYFEKRKPSFK